MNFWTPALGEVPLNLALFVRSSVSQQRKISELTPQFFLIFLHKNRGPYSKKTGKVRVLKKKSCWVRRVQK